MFPINNRYYLCIVEYNSKFQGIKQVQGFSKTVSDMDINLILEEFENFCRYLSICNAISLSYNHHSNGKAEACPKFVKKQ